MFSRLSRPWQDPARQGLNSIHLDAFSKPLEYQIKLSDRRKTVALEVSNQTVLVRAPSATPQYLINSFLTERQYWLLEKLTRQSVLQKNEMTFQNGDSFYFLGEKYRLLLTSGTKYRHQLNDDNKTLTLTIPNRVSNVKTYVQYKLKSFLIEQANSLITPRFHQLEIKLNLFAKDLEFKIYKRRWGCCYQSGLIRINPLIVCAPDWVIDCILIHELCHLKHLNHSAAFWNLNEQYCGNCDATKQWLQVHSHALQII